MMDWTAWIVLGAAAMAVITHLLSIWIKWRTAYLRGLHRGRQEGLFYGIHALSKLASGDIQLVNVPPHPDKEEERAEQLQ